VVNACRWLGHVFPPAPQVARFERDRAGKLVAICCWRCDKPVPDDVDAWWPSPVYRALFRLFASALVGGLVSDLIDVFARKGR
jgi:hypothetical protein